MREPEPVGRDAPSEQDDPVDALAQTAFAIMAVLTRVSADHDLSLTQLRVLAILRDRRLKMTELADYLGLDKSTMSGLVARAERRGLRERLRHPSDGRAIDVRISPAGAELAERVHARFAALLAPMTVAL